MRQDSMIVVLEPGNVVDMQCHQGRTITMDNSRQCHQGRSITMDNRGQCQQGRTISMDSSRQHMTGGRMAAVQPTHVRLPPQSGSPLSPPSPILPGPLGEDEVDVEKDNARNLAVRYHSTGHHKKSSSRSDKRSLDHHKRSGHSESVKRPGHHHKCSRDQAVDNKRASLPVSLALTNGLPLVLKNSGLEASARSPMLLCSQDAELQTWTLTPVVGLMLPQQLSRPKSSCSSSSSCSSADDVVDPPAPRSATDDPAPQLPPRGPNCYENIPVPGIIPLGRKAHSPTPGAQTTGDQTSGSVSKDSISLYSRLSGYDNDKDVEKIRRAIDRLKASGFFYDSVSATEAKAKLRDARVGTFLIRVSSQSSHLFALSVKTSRGTTSIRLAYENGNFRLDADPQSASKMPAFDCIIALIEYYVLQSTSDARNKCVFLESNGRRDTPVILTRPLREQPQGLKHLCRRTLHYNHDQDSLARTLHTATTPCSVQLRAYINSYPYAL